MNRKTDTTVIIYINTQVSCMYKKLKCVPSKEILLLVSSHHVFLVTPICSLNGITLIGRTGYFYTY